MCPALGFASVALSSRAKSSANYPCLGSAKGVSLHAVLPELEAVLVQAVPWSPRLTLNWVVPESHRYNSHRSAPQLTLTQLTFCCGQASVPGAGTGPEAASVSTGLGTAVLPEVGAHVLGHQG